MISPTLPCFHPLFLPKSFIGVDDDDHGGLESMKILKDPFATLHHSSFCVMCLCTGSTYTIQGITRGGFTIEFSEMRGPNKIFGPFCKINGQNILFGPLISENSIVTPPLSEWKKYYTKIDTYLSILVKLFIPFKCSLKSIVSKI